MIIVPGLQQISYEATSEDYSQYPRASFSQRAYAILLDAFFSGVLLTLLKIMMARGLGHAVAWGVGPLLLQASFVCAYYYFPLYASGETLGKRLVGIRVVSETGNGQLTFSQVLLRELVGKTLSALPLGYGYFSAASRADGKTFHDRLFGTRVVSFAKR